MTGLENIVNELLKDYEIREDMLWDISGHIGCNLTSYKEVEDYIGDEISKLRDKINEIKAYIKKLPKVSAEMHHIDDIYLRVKVLLNF